MLFCEEHLEAEFLKVEKRIKFIAIPLFAIIATLFIAPYPFVFNKLFFYHLASGLVGIIIIWFIIRYIIFTFRRHFPKNHEYLRFALQVLLSCAISISLDYSFMYFNHSYGYEKTGALCDPSSFDFKNFFIATLLFVILINVIYEGFYLFLKLSHTALESERYKKESAEARFQNLNSRLNPHFLFNSLNTLTAIVEEDPKKAVSYIQELSVVYRYVLNSQKETWIDLPTEIKFTQSYINLLRMRFEDSLIVNLDICEHHQTYYILPLTIQLLIENAVKHNEISLQKKLEVNIVCSDELLIVSNNKQKRNIMPSSTKVGLHNINERYRFLANKEVIVEDSETTFTVKVPLVKGMR
jgi:hypothetical protein